MVMVTIVIVVVVVPVVVVGEVVVVVAVVDSMTTINHVMLAEVDVAFGADVNNCTRLAITNKR